MASSIQNPFITTGYAGAEYFCDREQETADLIRLLTNGNNVALISPRRYGKTDLIKHCFAQPEIADTYYTFVIDIYSTKSVEDFVYRLGSGILEALKPRGKMVWEKFIALVSTIRPGISFDISGNPSWTMNVGDILTPQNTIEEIFKYLAQADRPCIVAIDEFQQITHYSDGTLEAALRTYVQNCPNAHFIFSGSQRHLMGQMFTSPARPFYQSVALYNLSLLPEDKYADFCIRLFEQGSKQIDADVPHELYNRFEGITYYMQRTMNELYSTLKSGDRCIAENIDVAIRSILAASSLVYEDLLYQLPEKQSRVLYAIAKEGKAKNLTSGKFVRKYGLGSPSSVKSAVPALLDKGLVTNEFGVYQIYDKFLELWIQAR